MKNAFWIVVLLAGCGGASSAADAPTFDGLAPEYLPAGYTRTPDLGTGSVHSFAAAEPVLEAGVDYALVLQTDAGRFVIDLLESAPVTTNSFVFLARQRFFDGVAFHRVLPGFVAQGGDPNSLGSDRGIWGYGDPGYSMDTESTAGVTFDGPGVVATANAGPGTNGSQFFITFAATPSLAPTDYTIFGRVIEGIEVLPGLARGEPPATPTRILSGYIVQRPL